MMKKLTNYGLRQENNHILQFIIFKLWNYQFKYEFKYVFIKKSKEYKCRQNKSKMVRW